VHINERGARRYALLHVFCVLTKVTHDDNFTLELGCITSKHVVGEAGVGRCQIRLLVIMFDFVSRCCTETSRLLHLLVAHERYANSL
jgi:hypothetical protein